MLENVRVLAMPRTTCNLIQSYFRFLVLIRRYSRTEHVGWVSSFLLVLYEVNFIYCKNFNVRISAGHFAVSGILPVCIMHSWSISLPIKPPLVQNQRQLYKGLDKRISPFKAIVFIQPYINLALIFVHGTGSLICKNEM